MKIKFEIMQKLFLTNCESMINRAREMEFQKQFSGLSKRKILKSESMIKLCEIWSRAEFSKLLF